MNSNYAVQPSHHHRHHSAGDGSVDDQREKIMAVPGTQICVPSYPPKPMHRPHNKQAHSMVSSESPMQPSAFYNPHSQLPQQPRRSVKESPPQATQQQHPSLRMQPLSSKPNPAALPTVDAKPWSFMFDLLCEYKGYHGHCHPSVEDENSYAHDLSRWVRRQRHLRQWLSSKCLSRLQRIGFAWTEQDAQWCREYYCSVTTRDPANANGLAAWVEQQRWQYHRMVHGKSTSMTPERARCLEALPRWKWKTPRKVVAKRHMAVPMMAPEQQSTQRPSQPAYPSNKTMMGQQLPPPPGHEMIQRTEEHVRTTTTTTVPQSQLLEPTKKPADTTMPKPTRHIAVDSSVPMQTTTTRQSPPPPAKRQNKKRKAVEHQPPADDVATKKPTTTTTLPSKNQLLVDHCMQLRTVHFELYQAGKLPHLTSAQVVRLVNRSPEASQEASVSHTAKKMRKTP